MNDHLSEKERFIRFRLSARAFRKPLSIYVFSYFPFGFEGRIWDLILSVPEESFGSITHYMQRLKSLFEPAYEQQWF